MKMLLSLCTDFIGHLYSISYNYATYISCLYIRVCTLVRDMYKCIKVKVNQETIQ